MKKYIVTNPESLNYGMIGNFTGRIPNTFESEKAAFFRLQFNDDSVSDYSEKNIEEVTAAMSIRASKLIIYIDQHDGLAALSVLIWMTKSKHGIIRSYKDKHSIYFELSSEARANEFKKFINDNSQGSVKE